MTIYSYVVRYDSGFAPNPFYGFCTLATCKPKLRERAKIGDWIAGFASASRAVNRGGHIVFAMKVQEACTFEQYWQDERFARKKPLRRGSMKQSCGDNIYYRNAAGAWIQADSFHSKSDGTPNSQHITHDTRVDRVLVSADFAYFGAHGPKFKDNLAPLIPNTRDYRRFDDPSLEAALAGWVAKQQPGFNGEPRDWA